MLKEFAIFVGGPIVVFTVVFTSLILHVGDDMQKGMRPDGLCSDTLMNRTWGVGIACLAERDRLQEASK